jgi:hypothetical protein
MGQAKWEVLNQSMAVIATGKAGQAAPGGAYAYFSIDFRSIVGPNIAPPLKYWVRVAVYSGLRSKEPIPPILSGRVKITVASPGPVTQFTFTGLHPELLHTLPIAIDLQSLKVAGGGDGQEPYLLVLVAYADGTSIVPRVNVAAGRIEFPDSSVRVASALQTHGNIAGDGSVDEDDIAPIPAATGHFETVLRPIGLNLVPQSNATLHRRLREATQVAVVVIGMEEGSVPSTAVMDQIRAELVTGVEAGLNNIIRGLTMPIANLQAPDFRAAVQQLAATLRQRLIASAKKKGMDEMLARLGIPGPPALMGFFGLVTALNRDEYVGNDIAIFTYEDILDAEEAGIDLTLNLSNSDSDLQYEVRGRLRIRF